MLSRGHDRSCSNNFFELTRVIYMACGSSRPMQAKLLFFNTRKPGSYQRRSQGEEKNHFFSAPCVPEKGRSGINWTLQTWHVNFIQIITKGEQSEKSKID